MKCSGRSDLIAKFRAVQAWRAANVLRWKKNGAVKLKDGSMQIVSVKDMNSEEDIAQEAQWARLHRMSLTALREIEEVAIQIRDALCDQGLAQPWRKDYLDAITQRGRKARRLEV